jgi:hypothetical protein
LKECDEVENLQKQYIEEIENIDLKIANYKKRLDIARRLKDFDEVFICQRLIKVFNSEREDLTASLNAINKYLKED